MTTEQQLDDKDIRFWCLKAASEEEGDTLSNAKKFWFFVKGETLPESKEEEEKRLELAKKQAKYDRNPSPSVLFSFLMYARHLNKQMEMNHIHASEFIIPPEFNDKNKEVLKLMVKEVNDAAYEKPKSFALENDYSKFPWSGFGEPLKKYVPSFDNKDKLITVYEKHMLNIEENEVVNL